MRELIFAILFILGSGLFGFVLYCILPILVVIVLNKFYENSRILDNNKNYHYLMYVLLVGLLIWDGLNLTIFVVNDLYFCDYFEKTWWPSSISLVVIVGLTYNYFRNGLNKKIKKWVIIITLIGVLVYSIISVSSLACGFNDWRF